MQLQASGVHMGLVQRAIAGLSVLGRLKLGFVEVGHVASGKFCNRTCMLLYFVTIKKVTLSGVTFL